MNTIFTVRLKMADERRSAVLAGECFRQLENLESLLSRYREDSDISTVNNLRAGESLLLHEETWSCLRIALEAHAMTGGLFDITIGSLTVPESPSVPHGRLSLNPDRPEITCIEPGRQFDLGGIGKGYALDRMADTLQELEAGDFLLSAGASTHLALGGAVWPMELAGDSESLTIELQNNSLSASGTAIQGNHIVHPFLEQEGASFPRRAWVIAKSAALSDALSTACFLAGNDDRRAFLSGIQDLTGIIVEDADGRIREIVQQGS